MLFSEAPTQVCVEFQWKLVFHDHKYGGLCMVMVFTPTTTKEYNNLYQEIMQIVYNSVDGWKDNRIL
jgi:hypothetical protein